MIEQRSRGQCFSLQPSISEFNRKITLLFHYLEKIEEYASQLFCTGEVEKVNEVMNIYKDFEKKIPLDWLLCVSKIMTILPKLKINTIKKN